MKFILTTFMTPTEQLPEVAVATEQAGWDGMTFSDHIINLDRIATPYPYTEDGNRRWQTFTVWPDPLIAIAALSTITRSLRFMTNVYVLPMRNVFVAAKAIGTAAVLSGNRLDLTIGVGWCREEFELMQQEFRNRGRRCDEMIEVLRKLWSGDMVSHSGRYYQFPDLEMNPAPTAKVPIRVGGISDAALRRAALLGDGWLSDLQSAADIVESIDKLKKLRSEAQLPWEGFTVTATPNDVYDVDGYKRLEEAGVSHIMMIAYAPDDSMTEKCDGLKRFADEVISKCN